MAEHAEPEEPPGQDEQAPGPREQDQEEPQPRGHPQGDEREGEEPVGGQGQQLPEAVLGGPRRPRGALVRERPLAEARPRAQAPHEHAVLGHGVDDVDDAPVHQAEVAGVEGHRDLGGRAQDAVEGAVQQALERPLLALLPLAVHDLVALPPVREARGDQLGRVLQVGIEDRDGLAARPREPGRDRGLVPEVAREAQDLEAGVGGAQGREPLVGAVPGTVVDEHDLPRHADSREGGKQALLEQGQDRDLVVAGDDDAQEAALEARHGLILTPFSAEELSTHGHVAAGGRAEAIMRRMPSPTGPQRLIRLLRRGLRKPPRVIARRAVYEAQVQAERYVAPWRARRFDARRLLRACEAHDLDSLWARLAARPYPAHTARTDPAQLRRLCPGDEERILAAAEDALAHRVRLLGPETVDLGPRIDWLRDFKTGVAWPRALHARHRLREPARRERRQGAVGAVAGCSG